MHTSLRLKICLALSLTCCLLLVAQSVLPSLFSSTLSLLHTKTDSTCFIRCGPSSEEPIASNGDSMSTGDGGTIVDVEPLTPKQPLFRTSFDSPIVAPPYLFILIVLTFATLSFFYYYLTIYRPNRFQLAGFEEESRVQVIIQSSPEVPSERIREHIQLFNRRLPKPLQRLHHETITEWFKRIKFPSPVDPSYFEVRYGDTYVLKVHQFTFFKQATDDFLRKRLH